MTRAVDELSQHADTAVIEMVASRPGQGVASQFSFGFSAGCATGALLSNGFSQFDERKKPLFEVSPLRWQNYYWELLGGRPEETSFDSIAVATQFHPPSVEFLTRVKDHNTADAILMALWYILTQPKEGSIRQKDRTRLGWLHKRFNKPEI
jgi:hypothetical protein